MIEAAHAAAPEGWGRLSSGSLALIRENLERTPAHPDALCLVADDDRSMIVGFITASLSGHPIMPGIAGEIEELYVRPGPDGATRRRALVDRALAWARHREARTIRTKLSWGAPWTPDELAFWEGLGFEHDVTVVSRYEENGC
jgi:GNAT superfamily N-acetyltransferase